MSVASIALAALIAALPAALFVALLPRVRRRHGRMSMLLGTLALGAFMYVPAGLVERSLRAWTAFDPHGGASELSILVYTFLIVAPLEQALKVASVVPVFRSRHFHEPIDGIVYASAGALGFVCAHDAVFLATQRPSLLALVRALVAIPAHPFFAATWGYALGRARVKRLGGRRFNAAWLFAMVFNGVLDHLVFERGPLALLAAAPIVVTIGVVTRVAAQDLLRRADPSREVTARFSAPSIAAVRDALRRTERPVMLHWIALGGLVTTGVITAALVGAVFLGHELGIDFSAVDAVDPGAAATAPLVLLGGATLAAFPIAGYLVARASSAPTILEPALAAGLAIGGALVLLGLAAPIAVVFALAFAPVAFGLACAGAWMGLAPR